MPRTIQFEGRTISVPDDATDAEVEQIIGGGNAPPQPSQGAQTIKGAGRAAVRGIPILGGLMDEINASLRASMPQKGVSGDMFARPATPGATYQQRADNALTDERATDAAFDKAHPVLSPALQIAGGITSGVGALRAAPTAAKFALGMGGKSVPMKALASGASGATLGALHGFAQGEGGLENRLGTGGQAGLLGGALGAAAPPVAGAIGNVAARVMGKGPAKVPTVPQLTSQGNTMYSAANNAGVVMTPQSFASFAGDVRVKMGKMNPKLYPKATGVLEMLDDAAKNPAGVTLEEADQLRQVAGDVLSSPEKGERRLAHIAIDALDDYVEKIGPADVMTGDPKAATSILSQARDIWARKSKGQAVERLIQRAKDKSHGFAGSGYENSLRREFINFASNERAMRRFSKAEQAEIRKVAQGGPVGNAMRLLGKLAPTSIVSGAPTWAAMLAGEPLTGAALGAAGLAGRGGATLATMGKAKTASEFMRRGGPAVASPEAQRIAEISRILLQGGNPATANKMRDYVPALPLLSRR